MAEKEYIEREELINELENLHEDNDLYYLGVYDCVKFIPAADVEEVWHGEWKLLKDWDWRYTCSICGKYAPTMSIRTESLANYCPHCGAKMDGKEVN